MTDHLTGRPVAASVLVDQKQEASEPEETLSMLLTGQVSLSRSCTEPVKFHGLSPYVPWATLSPIRRQAGSALETCIPPWQQWPSRAQPYAP